jgi:GAF domain-containing protein
MTERRDGLRGPSRISRLCAVCVERTGVDGGGVAVLSSERTPVLLHTTDEVARAVEDLQFTIGEGPSVEAAASGVPVLVPDTDEHSAQAARWPALLSELAALDVRAVFAFPIRVGEIALGTLDLYRRTPGELSAGEVRIGVTVGAAVGDSLLAPDSRGARADLHYPMSVHRAAGMVMVQLGTSIDNALVRMRATAFEEGIEVTRIASEVLDGTRSFVGDQT